jgi:hypothetical protein
MRSPVAVRIDIRPRLVLRDEQPAKPRRQWRMPPLALPAAGYWLAMAGLTYFFANLSTNPLESAWAAEVAEPSPPPIVNVNVPVPVPVPDLPPVTPAPEAPRSEPAPETVASANDDASQRDTAPTQASRRAALSSLREEPREEPVARLDPPTARLEFPEFSDSSRATPRERAADGPRLEGLFERRQDAPDSSQPAPDKAPETTRDAPTSVSSCEAAIARNNEQINIGGARGPADVSREQYAGILQNGRYLSGCAIPDRTVFEICAAVRDGRAIGITVTSSPSNTSLNACVRRAVSSLKFPVNPRLDVTHTRFDAARR